MSRLLTFLRLNWIPVTLFLVLLIQGSVLGLSDDEAYYWVLAQKPALGYAFHPPAVAWLIAGFQTLLKGLASLGLGMPDSGLAHPSALGVRFPAALSTALVLALAIQWLREISCTSKAPLLGSAILLSFGGYFALAWMMVPDISLFLGWMLLFTGVWQACFKRPSGWTSLSIAVGAFLLLLSKFSGILAVLSAGICLLYWSSGKSRYQSLLALVTGTLAGIAPTVFWNATHEWGSLLYQIRDRHSGGELSGLRYARFWLLEALLAGPVLLVFSLKMMLMGGSDFSMAFRQLNERNSRSLAEPALTKQVNIFCAVWALPAALVFCVQPLFSDFKLHWAFVVWWPACLALAYSASETGMSWRKKAGLHFQAIYGLTLVAFVLVSCHIPLGSWLIQSVKGGKIESNWDVSNDFYGWSQLGPFLRAELPQESHLPVIGSRYQTASQAAFSLAQNSNPNRVSSPQQTLLATLIPRDMKEMDEWPNFNVSSTLGPEWPSLKMPVLYVSDSRYQTAPQFLAANCQPMKSLETYRYGLLAKRIDIWKCDPTSAL